MPLQLDLRHYETIVAIVELGSMTEAARLLSSSQSALSHRLAEAERRLGVRLFDRSPQRRLTPTRAGLVVHQTASRALADLERSEALLLAEHEQVTATVRIAVGSYDCYHWYPTLVANAAQAHPEINLELVIVGDAPGTALASGAADVVIAPGRPEGPLTHSHLFDDELVLIVAPDHHLAGKSSIEADDLVDLSYLTYNSSPAPGFEYDRFIRPSDNYPRMVTVISQPSAIVELVAAGVGVSILSRWANEPAIESGRVVPIQCGAQGLTLGWSAVLRADEAPETPTRSIIDLLIQQLV